MTFDEIASSLLAQHGYDVLQCSSDEEAVDKAIELKNGSVKYPVHYSMSDTSGEKAYEEFFTDEETVDMERLSALGVIIGKQLFDMKKVDKLFKNLNDAFMRDDVSKEEIVLIMKEFLPNFEHIETGKSLDSKM